MQTPRLYILCGLPFSGKTTLAKELEKRLGFVLIEIHASATTYAMKILNSSQLTLSHHQRMNGCYATNLHSRSMNGSGRPSLDLLYNQHATYGPGYLCAGPEKNCSHKPLLLARNHLLDSFLSSCECPPFKNDILVYRAGHSCQTYVSVPYLLSHN